jgi:transcriptional regulator with XRE-family HTH domain
MATGDMERGPAGRLVAENVRRFRELQQLSLDDLSRRMTEVGWPIIASGLSKLERGARRIDVDDLTALAEALKVDPTRLLLPAGHEREDSDVLISEMEANIEHVGPVIIAARDALEAGVEPRIVQGAAKAAGSRVFRIFLAARLEEGLSDGSR